MIVVAVVLLLVHAGAASWLFESKAPTAAALRRSASRRTSWLAAGFVLLLGVSIVVPWVYAATSDDAEAPLSFEDVTPPDAGPSATTGPVVTRPAGAGAATSTSRTTLAIPNPSITAPRPTAPIDDGRGGDVALPPEDEPTSTTVDQTLTGPWRIGPGSIAGYRANEVLVLQHKETTGRTEQVTGTMVVDGLTVASATATVDMASVRSGDGQRDAEYRGRIMNVQRYPTADFRLTEPITLAGVPADGEVVTVSATGEFTIRGVTRAVTFPLQARLNAGRIEVLASIPVRWSDYGIPDPSSLITQVEDHGTIELLLLFDRAPNPSTGS